eukprot:355213-Chlamydomonas_euryale.AAC.2
MGIEWIRDGQNGMAFLSAKITGLGTATAVFPQKNHAVWGRFGADIRQRKPLFISQIIMACVLLHNFLIVHADDFDDAGLVEPDETAGGGAQEAAHTLQRIAGVHDTNVASNKRTLLFMHYMARFRRR